MPNKKGVLFSPPLVTNVAAEALWGDSKFTLVNALTVLQDWDRSEFLFCSQLNYQLCQF